jgi:hypothetical protein
MAAQRPRLSLLPFVASTLAVLIAVGSLSAVVNSFQKGGAPLERLVAAERACIALVFASERDVCIREWLEQNATTAFAKVKEFGGRDNRPQPRAKADRSNESPPRFP